MASVPRRSQAYSASLNAAITSIGVSLIICSRKLTVAGFTRGLPKPMNRVLEDQHVAGHPAALLHQHGPVPGGRAAQHHRQRPA